jgi:hypothetical protein
MSSKYSSGHISSDDDSVDSDDYEDNSDDSQGNPLLPTRSRGSSQESSFDIMDSIQPLESNKLKFRKSGSFDKSSALVVPFNIEYMDPVREPILLAEQLQVITYNIYTFKI